MRVTNEHLERYGPPPGKRRAFTVPGRYGIDTWVVIDETGRVVTSGDLFYCARIANEGVGRALNQ